MVPLVIPPAPADPLRRRIRDAGQADEALCLAPLIDASRFPEPRASRITRTAIRLVEGVRQKRGRLGDLDAILSEYRLATHEGVVLMCLAEALLRIPDTGTADRLIQDKIGGGNWERHLGKSRDAFVNASTWALMLTGRLIRVDDDLAAGGLAAAARRLAARLGEPVVREAMVQAMRILGSQFVMGRTIDEALARARSQEGKGWRHSFDMLGEAARSRADAVRYRESYAQAIAAIGTASNGRGPVDGPGISVKLSALHPRFEFAQRDRVLTELRPILADLCRQARDAEIGLTIDAEEADRLELTLDVVQHLAADPALSGWNGLGLAVQAYQKRALPVIDWVIDLARNHRRRIMVRLVKGAYWDSEIKRAQERGLSHYPVFTRKAATDVSALACAARLLAAGPAVFPQFATHNAHTVAAVLEMAGERRDWEFQRLHGMGEALYAQVVDPARPCRVYAPVGSHEDLLPYLVRRLLENGANASFVNRIADESEPIERIVAHPAETLLHERSRLPLPADLYAPERRNSRGLDLADPAELAGLADAFEHVAAAAYAATPIIGGSECGSGSAEAVRDPADLRRQVGHVLSASPADVARAVGLAAAATRSWDEAGGEARAQVLERASDLFEAERAALLWLAVREAGKTIPDAVAELREAVDFLRYYAARARGDFSRPMVLPGVTGEANTLSLHGRGVFACISPWNFPLAIFTGQVAAALAAGNAVVAKPAEQTPLIAAQAVRLLHAAGVPHEVLALLPGDGAIGAALVTEAKVAGVAFTGSTETARAIQRALAARTGPLIPLIAETGGQNAMIVDSSALPEQVVADVLTSAFQSAGQRCSALRVLFLQDDIHDRVMGMLTGAVEELSIGDPAMLATDIGPVIDRPALEALNAADARLRHDGQPLFAAALPDATRHGLFVAPRAYAVTSMPAAEVFGPILHVMRFAADRLDAVLDAIEETGSGLTLGLHSRIDAVARHVTARARVGNVYVNRSMIGAVVGSQPFGGEGLSGTGPKAGGPHTLLRFATERALSVNLAAAGGNATLLAQGR
ncbi:MAG: bifunctional proline dehydrogenase/L-glutamate gamma-semialdehyde dehydrogenase PutA [Magnetospirillum sp.]|nr:bifunctional proline dehydrogenase/L-glutamate gamma-semialdehyde dehydrogenase PutA [Magnetospirillum sp.]